MDRRKSSQVGVAALLVALALWAAPALSAEPKLTAGYLAAITQDEEAGPLYFPFSAYIDRARDEIYVVDGKGRVIIYSASFFPLVTIGKGSGILTPTSAAVDGAGNVYIAQAPGKGSPEGRISVLDACLKPLRQINFSGFEGAAKFSPQRMVRDPRGRIFAVGSGAAGIVVIEPGGGQRLLNPAAKELEGEPHFSALALDDAGNLYAVSEELGRVFVLDAELKVVRRFGQKGGSSGKLSRPQGVAADPVRGLYYVVDYMRHGVSVYDGGGKFLAEFGGLGLGTGWFQYPKDIALDSAGRLFVVDTFNQRLQVFELKGQPAPEGPQPPETEGPAAAQPDAASPVLTPAAPTPEAQPTPGQPQGLPALPEPAETPLPEAAAPSAPAQTSQPE